MLNINDIAPDFEVLDDTGKPTKLSDFSGKTIVLYFFPKAMTSG
jgi:peroxiredoxin Q/BCP